MDKKEIYRKIGWFYFEKNSYNMSQTHDEIKSLCITDVFANGNKINIKTCRPGYLIGLKGENIDNLKSYFEKELSKKIKINIIEDMDYEHLFTYQYI